MRHARLFAASAFALTLGLAACNENTPAASAPSTEETAAALATGIAEARAADLAAATAVHTEPGPGVYFVNLKDGDTVTSPFRVVFGVYGTGWGVAPALVDKPDTGHHHLMIDTELSAEEMKFAIPKDDQHLHFGNGQTETVLMLPAGVHTLQLVFGDMNHEMMKPAPMMSAKISITVK